MRIAAEVMSGKENKRLKRLVPEGFYCRELKYWENLWDQKSGMRPPKFASQRVRAMRERDTQRKKKREKEIWNEIYVLVPWSLYDDSLLPFQSWNSISYSLLCNKASDQEFLLDSPVFFTFRISGPVRRYSEAYGFLVKVGSQVRQVGRSLGNK